MGVWRSWGAQVGGGVLMVAALALALIAQGGVVQAGVVHPEGRVAKAAPVISNRYFGMHVPWLENGLPSALNGAVGSLNLTTDGVYWPQLEPTRGTFNFDRLDALVDQSHAQGAQPLLILGQTPAFHSAKALTGVDLGAVPVMSAWRTYVRHVASRYKSRIDYQIWPEANAASNWRGTPLTLAKLTVAAATIIHNVAPKAVVVSPAMVLRKPYQQHIMNRFFASKVGGFGVGHYVDAVAIDAYPLENGNPEASVSLIGAAHSILAKYKVKAPLWNVEINYGVAGGHVAVPTYSPAKQASYVARNYLLDAANGVKRVYWLGWANIAEMGIQMVQSDHVTPTAAGKAYLMVRSWMTGQTVPACTFTKAKHLYACKMVLSGHASWVYWTTSGTTKVVVPKGSRHLQRLLATPTGTQAGKRITVTTSPVRVYH